MTPDDKKREVDEGDEVGCNDPQAMIALLKKQIDEKDVLIKKQKHQLEQHQAWIPHCDGRNLFTPTNGHGDTPFRRAIREGYCDVVRSLLKHGDAKLIPAKNRFDALGFGTVLECDDVEMAQVLVESGFIDVVRDTSSEGKTVLFYARSPEMVQVLCKAGGTELINAKAGDGQTAMHEFATGKDEDSLSLIQCLVESFGANVFEQDEFGCTPLHYAAKWGQIDIAEYLAKKGGSKLVEAINDVEFTALHVAVCQVDESVRYNDIEDDDQQLAMIQCLVKSCKANILATDAFGCTALHLSVAAGLHPVSFFLVEQGGASLVSIPNTRGMTALHAAALGDLGHMDDDAIAVARAMVDAAGPNLVVVQDGDGRTALHCAAKRDNQSQFVQFLTDIGGDESVHIAPGSDGTTARDF